MRIVCLDRAGVKRPVRVVSCTSSIRDSARTAMTLEYADLKTKVPAGRSSVRLCSIIVLMFLFAGSAMLCIRAIRWDRWAHYEDTHRPRLDGFGGESYSSFKAWRAWRACWDRGLAAAV